MKRAFFLFFCSTNALLSFGQDSNTSKNIASLLASFSQNHPTEKAYLQFDKPLYVSGDTIYFKAYITGGDTHRLSTISGILHVELINPENKMEQSMKLQLDSGITRADFALPDSLPAGNYRIRAYTRWMRNDGDNNFFEKIICVGAIKPVKVPENLVKQPALNPKPDIQFLPEGGSLVTGINTKIAFKAIRQNGLGMGVNGIVTDNENKEVVSLSSAHLGMGEFVLMPIAGKTYSAKITYADGTRDSIALPKAETDGIALSVNNDSLPKAVVTITANHTFYLQNKGNAYTLLIYSGGLVATVNCKLDSPVIRLDILKRKLRTGVATATLFSSANEPLCERLFFVQNYDQLSLSINTDKTIYTQRENVRVELNALNRKEAPSEGDFSISAVNESLLPETNTESDNILTYLLLTSDLKGNVEQPNYYFADTSAVVRKNLDNLMLTQGYRRFDWKRLLDTTKRTLSFQPENGITISGRVDDLANKPIVNATINLIPSKGGGLLTASTDGNGLFQFSNLLFTDTARLVLSAVNGKGKNSTKIAWFNDNKDIPPILTLPIGFLFRVRDTVLSAYTENEKKELMIVSNYVDRKSIMLKQVNIRDKKPDNQYRTQSLAGAGGADQVMHAEELEQIQGSLVTSLNGRLHGVVFVGSGPFYKEPYLMTSLMTNFGPANPPKKMLIVIDGVQVTSDELNFLSSTDVETVELLKYASTSIYGVAGAGGVLVITTKQRRQLNLKNIPSTGVLPITVMGFYKARQFYSPKYDTPAALSNKQRDLRSTIYWNPEIKTDKDGNASFEYYNADGAGTYKVTIEGIDKDGNIGRQVYRYEVK